MPRWKNTGDFQGKAFAFRWAVCACVCACVCVCVCVCGGGGGGGGGYNGSLNIILLRVHQISETHINTLRPRQNGRHFTEDIFKRIFFNENVWISIKISLKFVPKGPINNIPALVHITAWHRSCDKPLSEPMMVSLPTHICVTRPQWVKGCPVEILGTSRPPLLMSKVNVGGYLKGYSAIDLFQFNGDMIHLTVALRNVQ